MNRIAIAALSLSATTLVGLAVHEGYRDKAYIPIPGDVPTIGFGTTSGVRMGDTITVERALVQLLHDTNQFERAIKQCVKVPLYQHEYDAIISWTYNVGADAACKSTLVKLLNRGQYTEACNQLTRWVYANGRKVQGLANRREKERQQCLGLNT